MAVTPRLIFLVGAAVSLAACTGEQVPPPYPQAMYHTNPNTVRKVQIALRHRGYYAGVVDGFLGQDTSYGIQRFQVDQCQRVKPVIVPPLLVSLGIATDSHEKE
jgi:peptidoglycan hydrolase-like protein with peptidoglycan-binding domain